MIPVFYIHIDNDGQPYLRANIFTTSSPETRPDWCDSVGTWRVAHRDRLGAALKGVADPDVYVTHYDASKGGRKRLYVGYRDNRHSDACSERTERLMRTMRSEGLSVRPDLLGGRIRGIIVTDKG